MIFGLLTFFIGWFAFFHLHFPSILLLKVSQLELFIYTPIIFLILVSVVSIADNGKKFHDSRNYYIEGELLVKFKENIHHSVILDTIKLSGNIKIKDIDRKNIVHIKLKQGQMVENAISEFESNPDVEYAQPNYIYRIMSNPPNDPYYNYQWGFNNTGQTIPDSVYNTNNTGTPGMDMDLELAWDAITDASSVIVAVVDSGVNYNHEDLSDNMWNGAINHGYDFVDDDNDPMDLNGHGTHVAGTIGAVGNNYTGTTGVAWRAQIMAVRVGDALGYMTTANVISGIYYAVDNGAQIINLSVGRTYYDQAEYDAINYARSHGVLVVIAAGNSANDNDCGIHFYPSDFDLDNIISVAALDQSYQLADFSNYGNISVDVGAPGTNIMSEWHGTEDLITDSLKRGWIEGGTMGWAYAEKDLGWGNTNLLVDPPDWGPPTWGYYSNSTDDRIWKTFNLNGYDSAVLNYWIMHDLEYSWDYYYVFCDNSTSDPFINGIPLIAWTGTTDGYFYLDQFAVPERCITSTCTIGFALKSDEIIEDYGVAICDFSISTLPIILISSEIKALTIENFIHYIELIKYYNEKDKSYSW